MAPRLFPSLFFWRSCTNLKLGTDPQTQNVEAIPRIDDNEPFPRVPSAMAPPQSLPSAPPSGVGRAKCRVCHIQETAPRVQLRKPAGSRVRADLLRERTRKFSGRQLSGYSRAAGMEMQVGKSAHPCRPVPPEERAGLERAGLVHEFRRVAHECVLPPGHSGEPALAIVCWASTP